MAQPIARGDLVVVAKGDSTPIYTQGLKSSKTSEYVGSDLKDTIVGTATGKFPEDGETAFVEVIQAVPITVANPVGVRTVYINLAYTKPMDNPSYDPTKDTDAPDDSTSSDSNSSSNDDVVGKTADGKTVTKTAKAGTVPVTSDDGKTVYVKVPADSTEDTGTLVNTTVDKNKKWLSYILFAVLGVALITLIVLLVRSSMKPKPNASAPNPKPVTGL